MADFQFDPEELQQKVENLLPNVRNLLVIGLLALLGLNSFFQIDPEEVGVITRFGKYSRTVDPGLNFKIPFTETVYKVPVENQQKLEFGFRTTEAGIKSEYRRSKAEQEESLMLYWRFKLGKCRMGCSIQN